MGTAKGCPTGARPLYRQITRLAAAGRALTEDTYWLFLFRFVSFTAFNLEVFLLHLHGITQYPCTYRRALTADPTPE